MTQFTPKPARYAARVRLETGEIASLEFPEAATAIGFAKRTSEGDWWEVIDNQTENMIASSDFGREPE